MTSPISGLSPTVSLQPSLSAPQKTAQAPAVENGPSFSDRLGQAVEDLAKTQNAATEAARSYQLGQTTDLAGVMVQQQVASLSFQLAVNVRNKALGAYKDIMNMPV